MTTFHMTAMAAVFLTACDNKVNEDITDDASTTADNGTGLDTGALTSDTDPSPGDPEDTGSGGGENPEDTGSYPTNATAEEILIEYCYECHGQGGRGDGGFDYIRDTQRMVDSEYLLVPGDADASRIFEYIVTLRMPRNDPGEPLKVLSEDEVQTLRDWINVTLLNPEAGPEERDFIPQEDEFALMKDDLLRQDASKRPFIRYLTLVHLYNAGVPDDELVNHRWGLSKAVNNLSRGRYVVPPTPIDDNNLIFRVNLIDYGWDANGTADDFSPLWDTLIESSTYAVLSVNHSDASELTTQTRTAVPWVRGDWFTNKATQPPLYWDLLGLPETIEELEASLGVNAEENIDRGAVIRSGTTNSDPSVNHRILERHAAGDGGYWKSYDFGDVDVLKNVLDSPLGPGDGPGDFLADGGEMIFALPNGLSGYYVTDEFGFRLADAPNQVVSDPEGPIEDGDGAGIVRTGISCMRCHNDGYKDKADEVRPHVEANPEFYSPGDFYDIMNLYRDPAEFTELVNLDKAQFDEALLATGNEPDTEDTVTPLFVEYQKDLTRKRAAAELGLTDEALKDLLLADTDSAYAGLQPSELEELQDLLSVLKTTTPISRTEFEEVFPAVACLVGYGLPLGDTEALLGDLACEPGEYDINDSTTTASEIEEIHSARDRVEPIPFSLDD